MTPGQKRRAHVRRQAQLITKQIAIGINIIQHGAEYDLSVPERVRDAVPDDMLDAGLRRSQDILPRVKRSEQFRQNVSERYLQRPEQSQHKLGMIPAKKDVRPR
jgi:hypothetical protein